MLDIKQLPLIAAITLGVLIAAGATWQALQIYQKWQSPPPELAQSSQPGNRQASPATDLPLDQVMLFGEPGEEDSTELVETENLPETNLRLVLRGVMAGELEQGRNSALVEGPDKETDLYFVGETLPGNARLHKVHQRRIVIERNGALETLHFPDVEELSLTTDRGNSQSNRNRQRTRSRQPEQNSSNRQQEVRARLDELRLRLRGN